MIGSHCAISLFPIFGFVLCLTYFLMIVDGKNNIIDAHHLNITFLCRFSIQKNSRDPTNFDESVSSSDPVKSKSHSGLQPINF